MKTYLKPIHIITLATLICTNSTTAQEDTQDKDYLSPFNVIGSKEDIPELEGTGTVLATTDLKPFFHTDVNEILREVPGVYLRGEEGYGLFPNISLRGLTHYVLPRFRFWRMVSLLRHRPFLIRLLIIPQLLGECLVLKFSRVLAK